MKKKFCKKRYIILGIFILLLFPFCYWQNNAMEITEYPYYSPKVTDAWEGCRIVQISDLHNKRFGKGQRHLLDIIKECHPDYIVLTGDLVDSNRFDLAPARELVSEAVKIAPVYYITGNHELWLDKENYNGLLTMLSEEKVVILKDDCETLTRNGDTIELIGLDDASLRSTALHDLTKETTDHLRILLSHEPQYFEKYCAQNVDLVLTGHAHGGQFILAFVGPVVAPDQGLFPKYTQGRFENNGTTMLISRGLGNSVIPVRLFNFPEIVCVELRKE